MNEEKNHGISINLNCYTIRFRKKNQKTEYYKVEEAFKNKAFKEWMQEFVNDWDKAVYLNNTKDRILHIDKSLAFTDTYYSGILKKGYSGQETYIEALDKGKAKIKNTVAATDFNSSPFYFLVACPDPKAEYLIFLAQSYKQYGYKDLFEEVFKKFFSKKYDDEAMCDFGTLTMAALFEEYLGKGIIRKLRFKKHTLGKNIENLLSKDDDPNLSGYEMELSISAKKKGFVGIKSKIKSTKSTFIETVKIDNFDYDEAFADVTLAGRKRILNVTKPETFSAAYDLTDRVKIDTQTKHPDFAKLNTEATDILIKEIVPFLNK